MCVGNFKEMKTSTTHVTTSISSRSDKEEERGRRAYHCWRREREGASPAVVAGGGRRLQQGEEGVGEEVGEINTRRR